MRLAEVCLITGDVKALAQYYATILQLPFEGDEIHANICGEGGLFPAFYNQEAAQRDMGLPINPAGDVGRTVLNFNVEDVDLEYQRLSSLGIHFIQKPTTYPWGSRSMQWLDPDGNLISFHSRPKPSE